MTLAASATPAEQPFVVTQKMRCQPAKDYVYPIGHPDSGNYLLQLKNEDDTMYQLLLEFPIQQIDKIDVIQYDEKKQIVKQYAFTSKKLSERIYYDRNVVLPVELPAHSTHSIFMKVYDGHSFAKQHPEILVWKKDAKQTRTEALELTRGVFYGILILYAFICFILTILINVKTYYYYLFYLITGVMYLFVKNNLGYELLWPDHPNIDIFMKKIMLSLYMISSILFLRGFIQKRINMPTLQNVLRYFIYFGFLLILVSLIVGLLSTPAQHTFIIIQNVFTIVSLSTVIITFVFVYFNTNERSLVLFTLLYFISFSFFLFYPQPEFGSSVLGVYIGQIYTYSNAFIIALIISISTVYRVFQIIRFNEQLKKEVSVIHAKNNFSLIEGQQNERTRVGQELHDGIGIMMSAIKMKMSAIKAADKEEEKALREITSEIDDICHNIRQFSHTLLPPTLKKFGLQVALKDMLDDFKVQHPTTQLTYNFTIPDNLSMVSRQLMYDFVKNFLQYFSENRPEQLSISIYVIPSIREAQIRIQHTGMHLDENHPNIKSVISVIDLLNGEFRINLLNAWNFKLRMEFPVLLDEKPVHHKEISG